jgi:hypothetical protein
VGDDQLETICFLALLEQVIPEDLQCSLGVLSGPTFAREVAMGLPAAVTLAAGETISLEARIYSVTPLAKAELIRSGEIIAEFPLEGTEAMISFEDSPEASSWYLLRVFAADGDRALTNPIWAEVG